MGLEKTYEWPLAPEEEDRIVDAAFREVLDAYIKSNHRRKVEMIERAYRFAKEAHKGARRRSGEPYILHPIAVAKIVISELGLGSTSICAALLHDVVEDTEYTREDIEAAFDPKIASIVDGLTKISGGIFDARSSVQAENFRKLLLSMSTDVRVVLIKMADRLHNMRTLEFVRPEKQLKICGETLYVYAPLAHRLGLHKIKTELQDLAFRHVHPQIYADIMARISETEEERQKMAEEFIAPVRRKLDAAGFKYEIRTRVKSAYSIWNKMEKKKISFDEVYDLYAVRVVFENDDDSLEKLRCFEIYTFFTDDNVLHPDRTRDWVSSPKPNGYRALHLTAMGPRGKWVEVQIRSRKMDEIAELGYAAHWKYKEGVSGDETELDKWMERIKDILAHPDPSALDFLDTIKLNLFASEIYVFTPKGELKKLPKGSTVLDMAFNIHTQLGMHCMAGKVNHRLVPMSHPLESGDQVEIITSESQTPEPAWLEYAFTARAKTRIDSYLRKDRKLMIEKGEKIFTEYLEKENLRPGKTLLRNIQIHYGVKDLQELYLKLAKGEINLSAEPASEEESGKVSFLRKLIRNPFASKRKEDEVDFSKTFILMPGLNPPNYKLDTCCQPLPGDDVMGYVNEKGEVVVHKASCEKGMQLSASSGERLIATVWGGEAERFMASIAVEGLDRMGLLESICHLLSQDLGINIRGLNIEANNEVFNCKISVMVDNVATVNEICERLLRIKGVKSAKRIS